MTNHTGFDINMVLEYIIDNYQEDGHYLTAYKLKGSTTIRNVLSPKGWAYYIKNAIIPEKDIVDRNVSTETLATTLLTYLAGHAAIHIFLDKLTTSDKLKAAGINIVPGSFSLKETITNRYNSSVLIDAPVANQDKHMLVVRIVDQQLRAAVDDFLDLEVKLCVDGSDTHLYVHKTKIKYLTVDLVIRFLKRVGG